jgi:peptidoglycan hydrolase-like protein with peptidoglycan-binding domain
MGQQQTVREEDHGFVRRILGLGDVGEDVRRLQHALNRERYRRRRYLLIRLNEKILGKRLTPELWGYCWAPGALRQFRKHHLRPFKLEVPDPKVLNGNALKEDGSFGPKTEKAVIQYQRKVGLPDDGIVGPEVWEHLFPFWVVKIIVLDSAHGTAAPPNSSPSPSTSQGTDTESESTPASAPKQRFIGSPFAKATIDNIAEQLGIQKDKDGLTAIFVLQATWKTESDPNEMVAGHWEHTGGLQVNTPIGRPGQNLQAYYQLTRAEVMSIDITDSVDLQADLWVQPTVQVPLDSGTPSKPNLAQVGVTAGATVSLEIKGDKDRPTVKVFAQGAGVATVDSRGKAATGGQVVGGISVEFDADSLKGSRQEQLAMTADPAVVTLKPGGSASVKLKVKPAAQKAASISVGLLPTGVTANMFDVIPAFQDSGVLHLSAAPNAPAANQGNILVSTDLADAGEKPKVASTRIQVIVAA